jgi:hypothetical protein
MTPDPTTMEMMTEELLMSPGRIRRKTPREMPLRSRHPS